MKRLLCLTILLLTATGCVDNIESLTREYRAATNEGIDALSMITSEAHAKRMSTRVFKPMTDRFQKLDKKLDIIKNNRTKVEMVEELFDSDGLHIFLSDLIVNRQRFALEIIRLRALEKHLVDEAGAQDNPRTACPALHDLLNMAEALKPLRRQLTDNEIYRLLDQLPAWKTKNYEEMYAKFEKRRPTFEPKRVLLVH
jgi:hypothetical protein